MKNSGFSLTRPVWAQAYGLPRAPTTSPRAKTPRWRESLPSRPRPEAPRTLASGDPPATTQTASADPARPVPTGARSVASKRLIRRALGREAANARIMSKKNKIQGWEKCKQHLGGPLRLQGSLAHFQRAAPAQKFTGSSNQLQNNEQQTANNNTHLQLASSNTFRSYIVLRQTAVHSVQPARTSDEFCAGGLSVSKSTCKKK